MYLFTSHLSCKHSRVKQKLFPVITHGLDSFFFVKLPSFFFVWTHFFLIIHISIHSVGVCPSCYFQKKCKHTVAYAFTVLACYEVGTGGHVPCGKKDQVQRACRMEHIAVGLLRLDGPRVEVDFGLKSTAREKENQKQATKCCRTQTIIPLSHYGVRRPNFFAQREMLQVCSAGRSAPAAGTGAWRSCTPVARFVFFYFSRYIAFKLYT